MLQVLAFRVSVIAAIFMLAPLRVSAQGTIADYQRAAGLRDRYQNLAYGVTDQVRWVYDTPKVVYRKTVRGGFEFVMADGDKLTRAPAFDHAKLAAGLSTALKRKVGPLDLPFTQFTFNKELTGIEFQVTERNPAAAPPTGPAAPPWRCSLENYLCVQEAVATGRGGRGGRGGGGLGGPVRPELDVNGGEPKLSPDGKREAMIRNYNVAIRTVGSREVVMLSTDGSEGGYYEPESLVWSPDSTRLAVYKVRPGQRRYVHYVESSPEDQLQPKHSDAAVRQAGRCARCRTAGAVPRGDEGADRRRHRALPRRLRHEPPGLAARQLGGHLRVQPARPSGLPRDLSRRRLRRRPRASSPKNRRRSSATPARSSATTWTTARRSSGCPSATDGTISTSTTASPASVKHQITQGAWAVRSVVQVDTKARQIYFAASGMYPGQGSVFRPLLPHQLRWHRTSGRSPEPTPTTPSSCPPMPSTTSTPIRAWTPAR